MGRALQPVALYISKEVVLRQLYRASDRRKNRLHRTTAGAGRRVHRVDHTDASALLRNLVCVGVVERMWCLRDAVEDENLLDEPQLSMPGTREHYGTLLHYALFLSQGFLLWRLHSEGDGRLDRLHRASTTEYWYMHSHNDGNYASTDSRHYCSMLRNMV
ncbi:hypothetical protein AAVH_24859 [Aphelenchoides avenae]|nr:hypothetical protein AAVH_24859 [Aphelenchus avenae]